MKCINVGDRVRVAFSTHPPIEGKVTYTPAATGDCWYINEGDFIYAVQQYDYMEKLNVEETKDRREEVHSTSSS